MTVIVNTGTTLTVTSGTGLTITLDSTIAPGGLLDGSGVITGNRVLLNQGTISADVPGAGLTISTATLTSSGTILAGNAGLTINASVATTNLVGTTLTGGAWEALGTGTIELRTGQIVTDNAIITLDGTASAFDGFDSAHGTLQPIDNSLATIGASGVLNVLGGRNFQTSGSLVLNGSLTIGGGNLAVPTGGLDIGVTGDLAGFGAIDSGTPVVDNGTIEARDGTLTAPGAASVIGTGTLQADAGGSLTLRAFGSYAQSIVNNGTIDAAFAGLTGTLGISGPYSGAGGFLIQGGPDSGDRTVLELPASLSADVAFDMNFGELLLDSGTSFNGTVSGFGDNDTIVLSGILNAAHAALSGNILNLTDTLGGLVDAITVDTSSLNYQNAVFQVTENAGQTQTTLKVSGVQPVACFAAGTRIKTESGAAAVESLKAGDIVFAHFAGTAPIVWIGQRHIDCRRHPEPSMIWPVRVSAHAFAPRMPDRDVVLSPDHAVFIDDVLIPIKQLINGVTVVQERADAVTYYHVELGEHDVLLADGLPAESYLETGSRADFDNADGVIALHPEFGMRRWEAFGCAPLVVTGPKLDAVVARLRARMPGGRRAGRARRAA
jgi:hypothetical protein